MLKSLLHYSTFIINSIMSIVCQREAYLTIDSNDDVIAFHSYSDNRHCFVIIVIKCIVIIIIKTGIVVTLIITICP